MQNPTHGIEHLKCEMQTLKNRKAWNYISLIHASFLLKLLDPILWYESLFIRLKTINKNKQGNLSVGIQRNGKLVFTVRIAREHILAVCQYHGTPRCSFYRDGSRSINPSGIVDAFNHSGGDGWSLAVRVRKLHFNVRW